jgi:hypothetical protein
MDFSAKQRFSGNLDKAFTLAESALTAIGFRITERSDSTLELVGPGMNSSRDSALVGASRIQMRGDRHELSLEAELGGVARMTRFVTFFPPALLFGLGLLLSIVFSVLFGPGLWILAVFAAVGGNALVWMLLGPLIARSMQARTRKGLESLLANMVTVGES